MTTGETRLDRRIRRDFPEPGSAPEILRLLDDLPRRTGSKIHGSERVQAAIILLARGDIQRFRDAITLSTQDWRDVLVTADLAHEDWPARLDQELGPVTSSEGSK
jgi:hypothetical protein